MLYTKQKLDESSISNFIKDFFLKGNPATYNKAGTYQCREGAGRTLIDLMRIVRGVFPKATKKDVVDVLLPLAISKEIAAIGCVEARGVTFHVKRNFNGLFGGRTSFGGNGVFENEIDHVVSNSTNHEDNISSARELYDIAKIEPTFIREND